MAVKKQTAAPVSDGKAAVFIPKTNRDDTQTYVSVNGKNAVIRNGEVVRAPKSLAWAVRDAQKAQAKADEFIDANAK